MSKRTIPPSPQTPPGGVRRHGSRIFDDLRHDPYQARVKYHEPTVCDDCGAVFHHGHWQRGSPPATPEHALCPACKRVRDKLPAGQVTLEGAFFAAHRDEVLHLVHHEAEHEQADHPLARIMEIVPEGERTRVTTTDIHLPQRIGEALRSAYQGELTVAYGKDEYSVRVDWRR
jgi:hypothetical protein